MHLLRERMWELTEHPLPLPACVRAGPKALSEMQTGGSGGRLASVIS